MKETFEDFIEMITTVSYMLLAMGFLICCAVYSFFKSIYERNIK